jgi:class 3 adenylate cyclase
VRIGLHTGEPVLNDEGYVGVDVHRAARIARVAHGGQIVASRATRELVPECDFVDLGEHCLKDLTRRSASISSNKSTPASDQF